MRVNLRGHYWSDTADYEALDFATYVGDVDGRRASALGGDAVAGRPRHRRAWPR